MTVTLQFTFDSIEAATEFMLNKAAAPAAAQSAPEVKVDSDGIAPEPVAAAPEAPAPKKRGRKPKTSAPDADAPAAAAPAAEVAAAPTITEVRAALMKVNDKFGQDGLAKVAELIAPFGVQKINELKPEQFPNVIAAAQALV